MSRTHINIAYEQQPQSAMNIGIQVHDLRNDYVCTLDDVTRNIVFMGLTLREVMRDTDDGSISPMFHKQGMNALASKIIVGHDLTAQGMTTRQLLEMIRLACDQGLEALAQRRIYAQKTNNLISEGGKQ